MMKTFETPGELIFIGSSVCLGSGATDDHGWSYFLGRDLENRGWKVSNCAIGGQNTTDILLRLNRDVIEKKPDVCIVGLGLANEGLPGTEDQASGMIIQGIFEHNLQKIVLALREAGIRVILGGVYPNDEYNVLQYQFLKETRNRMNTWDVPVFQWLDALDDGHGHFRAGLACDPGHPNDAGYQVMYRTAKEMIGC